MNRIIEKVQLSKEIYKLKFLAPSIAEERQAGQFLILQLDTDFGERIPLTIADANRQEGSVAVIFQTVGNTTHRLAALEVGDTIANVLGPLGKPTRVERFGWVLCVGGGIGSAPLFPIAQAMQRAGNLMSVIIGAKTKELLILEKEMRDLSEDLVVCTDDGSYGRKALVTEPLGELCNRDPRPDLMVAIGPPVMMKNCCETTRPFRIPTVVSLNTIMVDGTGMCGGCRVSVGGRTKFVCVDGPEFDGHHVDFDNLMLRLGAYRSHEETAHHKCHLDLQIQGATK